MIDGAPLDAPAPPLNELLAASLATAPDEPAVVSISLSMTWRELEEGVRGWPAATASSGSRSATASPR